MRAFSGASLGMAALALSVSVGCSQVGQVQAKRSFKAANAAYQAQDYKKAAGLYEETLKADPNLSMAYFFLGNSFDNQYKPSRKGEAANDELLTKAIDNYKQCAEKLASSPLEQDKKLANLALQYGAARVPVHISSVVMLTEIVFASGSAVWLAGEVLTPAIWMGGGLILLAALLAAREEPEGA